LTDLAWGFKKTDGKSLSYQLRPSPLQAALRGSVWGTIAGALFLEPFFGMLMGGTTALLLAGLRSDEEQISRRHITDTLERKLEPGHSALFLMVEKATPDKVMARLYEHKATIVSTSLSLEKERKLREMWQKVQDQGPLSLHIGRGPKTQLLE
jgi:uncharacterized membrane protein